MSGRSKREWEVRQAKRLHHLQELESKAEAAHRQLVDHWLSEKHGARGKTLLAHDRKVHAELEQARAEYMKGLKGEPS
jgi:hypothetical protein